MAWQKRLVVFLVIIFVTEWAFQVCGFGAVQPVQGQGGDDDEKVLDTVNRAHGEGDDDGGACEDEGSHLGRVRGTGE